MGRGFSGDPVTSAPLPPGPSPMPPAFLIPRTAELAAQVLPAAGAFTAQAFSAIPAGTKRVAYWVSYTGAAAAGFPKFRVQYSNGTDSGGESVLDLGSLTPSTTSLGWATVSIYQETLAVGAAPGAAVAWTIVVQFQVPDNSTGVRLLAAESGDTAAPGTIATAFTGAGGVGA